MIAVLASIALLADFNFRQAAEDLTTKVETQFWNAAKGRYVEDVSLDGQPGPAAAFTWDLAVYLSAAGAECRFDSKKYKLVFDRILRSMDGYGCDRNGVYGYSDLPVSGDRPDRYYDDNEWMVLALLDAYDATHNKSYLGRAERLFKFVMSGESDELGGGIFWRENEKKWKNTCSNAPAAFAAARLFQITQDRSYLQAAERIYSWLAKLRDTDGLMFDHIDLSGRIEKTKWTYNTALTIEAGIALWMATGKKSYLDDAKRSGVSAKAHWVDPETGAIRDDASFAHHLSEAFLALGAVGKSADWRDTAARAVEYAYKNSESDSFYGRRWDGSAVHDRKLRLLDQASMLRGLAAMASAK